MKPLLILLLLASPAFAQTMRARIPGQRITIPEREVEVQLRVLPAPPTTIEQLPTPQPQPQPPPPCCQPPIQQPQSYGYYYRPTQMPVPQQPIIVPPMEPTPEQIERLRRLMYARAYINSHFKVRHGLLGMGVLPCRIIVPRRVTDPAFQRWEYINAMRY